MALRGPAAVAVHDDGHVRGQPIELDLARQRRVGMPRRNPRQHLVKRHGVVLVDTSASIIVHPRRGTARAAGPSRPPVAPARDRSSSAIDAGSRQPRPTSTSVPTIARTMWRRKPSPRDFIRQQARAASTSSCNMCAAAAGATAARPRRVIVRMDPDDVAADAAERGEVVRALEQPRPPRASPRVERLGHVPDVRALERADERGVADQIAIGLRRGR